MSIEHPIYADDFIFMADPNVGVVNIVFTAQTAKGATMKGGSGTSQAGVLIDPMPVVQVAMSKHTFLRLAQACSNALQTLPDIMEKKQESSEGEGDGA
jgi:hypothetical protein